MKKQARHLAWLPLVLLAASVSLGAEAEAETLVGSWELDPQASVEGLGHLGRWSSVSETERESLRTTLEKRAEGMVLEITDKALTLRRGDRETTFPCSTRYRTPAVVVLACSAGETPITVILVPLAGDRLKFLSSATDDMDVYVWKRRS